MHMKKISFLAAVLSVLAFFNARAQAQVVIPETYALPSTAADKSKPGFIWNVFQNAGNTANNNQRTEDALAGRLKDAAGVPLVNEADPAAIGGAAGEGRKLGTADNALIQFDITDVINFSQSEGENNGSIRPDLGMPGIPGTGGSTDGISAEVLTWLDLPAGDHTLIVNSDDGFLLSMGGSHPSDQFATFVGQFNGGRGAADTTMRIKVTKAGVYATRLTWEEGGGGANVEFVEVKGSTRVAVNSADSTIKAYRAVTGPAVTYARVVSPAPGNRTAPFDAPVEVELVGAGVNASSVKLNLDGQDLAVTATKSGDVTSIKYTPPSRFPPRSVHNVVLTFNDGAERRREWTFTTVSYALLTADLKVTPDTSKPGFIWNVHQNNAFQANNNTRPVQQLEGRLGVNLADPAAQGVAIAAGKPGANDRLPIQFEIDTTISMSQAGGESNGEFPDDQMPGIPGTGETANTDGIAGELLTYIDLPAGVHTFIVNSDDGFFTTAGVVNDLFRAQMAGTFEGGRGAADTAYRVVVQDAGVYAFRTVWYEGGGGANIEWKTQKADGTRVLINDKANGGFAAYRATSTGAATAITSVSPGVDAEIVAPNAAIEAVITEGSTTVDTASVKLTLDGASVSPTVTKSGKIVSVKFQPASEFPSNSSHTAKLTYTAGGTERSEEWKFTVPPITRDKVKGYTAFIIGAAVPTADKGGVSGAAGDLAIDLGRGGARQSVYVLDASFVSTAAADDTMTFSVWQKLHEVANSSLFWANSPSSRSSERGWQAHTPWGDSTIYFDTAGCCDAAAERINANISTYAKYTGDQSWWYDWHHLVFTKNGSTKRVYIDGDLFLEGDNTNVLPQDFRDMWIGAQVSTANNLRGLIDEFAIYSGALSEADVKKLAGKAAANSVAGLVAHWDFNDATVTGGGGGGGGGNAAKLSVTRSGANLTINSDPQPLPAGWVLQTATSITGPWTNVSGNTPHTIAINNQGPLFIRAIKP